MQCKIASLCIQKYIFFPTEKNVRDKVWRLGGERLKNWTSFGQILGSQASSGAKDSSFTPNHYMFRALGEVMSSATVICVQSVSQAYL